MGYVTGEMWKNKPPFRLCLNKAAGEEIIWHCKHYTGRGVMKYYESGADLAKDMGVPLKTLEDEHEQHYQASQKAAKDPEGGKWPAYPSGKSWTMPVVRQEVARNTITTSSLEARSQRSPFMLLSLPLSY